MYLGVLSSKNSQYFKCGVVLLAFEHLADFLWLCHYYGGQDWTALCLVVAEQWHVVSHQSPIWGGHIR